MLASKSVAASIDANDQQPAHRRRAGFLLMCLRNDFANRLTDTPARGID